jgi:NAD(P)H-flavin reductase
MVQSHPGLDYQLLHGVSYEKELYEASHFSPDRLISCITREQRGVFQGRVTEYLQTLPLHPDHLFYFCGNSAMIYDAFQLLTDRGVAEDRMVAEIYF